MNENDIRAFYATPAVRRRIAEYLGVENGNPATCVYLAQPDSGWPWTESIRRPDDVDALLKTSCDVARSLWDRDSLIAHLDIEYVNFDFPGEPYIHPGRSFRIQDSVSRVAETILARHGIDALSLVTGRGYHYVWRIPSKSAAFRRLHQLGHCNDTLLARYRRPGLPIVPPMPPEHGRAFSGLGLIMEHAALQIRAEAAKTSPVPVQLTAVSVGPGERGREMVSIDVSEYGDPLYLRVIRVPFTAYRKASKEQALAAQPDQGVLLSLIAPKGASLASILPALRDPEQAARFAERTSAHIPDAAAGTERLIADYAYSPLRVFHDEFYAQSQHPPDRWNSTYDRLPMTLLPPCASHILQYPNDLLMQPAAIELIVRVMLALGWHPRHIAGLIRSKYERNYGWGTQWLIHDAATRADFYTRIFAGAFITGEDDLIDFNCTSAQEKGLCVMPRDGCALASLQTSLRERRRYGRLAHRPFNRLFLPHEHL